MPMSIYATAYSIHLGKFVVNLAKIQKVPRGTDYNSYDLEEMVGKWIAEVRQEEQERGYYIDNDNKVVDMSNYPFITLHTDFMHPYLFMSNAAFDCPESAMCAVKQYISNNFDDSNSCETQFPEYRDDIDPAEEDLDEDGCRNVIYFVIYSARDESIVTVCDVSEACSYERHEFRLIDDNTFRHPLSAIEYAKAFARLNFLKYEPFDSRYGSSFSEVQINKCTKKPIQLDRFLFSVLLMVVSFEILTLGNDPGVLSSSLACYLTIQCLD